MTTPFEQAEHDLLFMQDHAPQMEKAKDTIS